MSGFGILGKAEYSWLLRPARRAVIDAEASHKAVFNIEVNLDIADSLHNKNRSQASVAWNDHRSAALDMEPRPTAILIVHAIEDGDKRKLTLDVSFQTTALNHEFNACALEVVHIAKCLAI